MDVFLIAGPAACLDDPRIDCEGHGSCEKCNETCISQGFKLGGGCFSYRVCCCQKIWNNKYLILSIEKGTK